MFGDSTYLRATTNFALPAQQPAGDHEILGPTPRSQPESNTNVGAAFLSGTETIVATSCTLERVAPAPVLLGPPACWFCAGRRDRPSCWLPCTDTRACQDH